MYNTEEVVVFDLDQERLGFILTNYGVTYGILPDERYILDVSKLDFNPESKTIRAVCDVLRYVEH